MTTARGARRMEKAAREKRARQQQEQWERNEHLRGGHAAPVDAAHGRNIQCPLCRAEREKGVE